MEREIGRKVSYQVRVPPASCLQVAKSLLSYIFWGVHNKQLRKWKLRELKGLSQEWTASQGQWWGWGWGGDEDPGDWPPHMVLFFYTLSRRLQSVEEHKVMSNERTINKEGKRVSRERWRGVQVRKRIRFTWSTPIPKLPNRIFFPLVMCTKV